MGKLHSVMMIQLLIMAFSTIACASSTIWTGKGELSSIESLSEGLKTHSVIIIGENHYLRTHQEQQLQIMENARKHWPLVSVGMEFFSYIYQDQVDSYRLGQINEVDFLKSIEWGNAPFKFYKDQVNFPRYNFSERTWALNAPKALTSAISKSGLQSLTPELQKLLPPNFTLGRETYRARFQEAMGGHITDPQKFQNYFEAQSAWDDTMAWRVVEFKKLHPRSALVIVVGEFHAQYGGGLPDRLKARGVEDILVISQVNTKGLTDEEIQKQIQPDPEYGPRADWIWTAPAVD